jgi:hypothetical protein
MERHFSHSRFIRDILCFLSRVRRTVDANSALAPEVGNPLVPLELS